MSYIKISHVYCKCNMVCFVLNNSFWFGRQNVLLLHVLWGIQVLHVPFFPNQCHKTPFLTQLLLSSVDRNRTISETPKHQNIPFHWSLLSQILKIATFHYISKFWPHTFYSSPSISLHIIALHIIALWMFNHKQANWLRAMNECTIVTYADTKLGNIGNVSSLC